MRMPEEECLPTLSLSPRRLLRFAFAFASISCLLLSLFDLRECWAGAGDFRRQQYRAFLCAGAPKEKQDRLGLSLALQTGEAAFCFLDTAYSSRLAVLCTNGISHAQLHWEQGIHWPAANIPLGSLTTTTTTTTAHPASLYCELRISIRRNASEAARCTMNLRLDIIACHFALSHPHE
jgi:hypothetical protein